jgi:hypothetical protein
MRFLAVLNGWKDWYTFSWVLLLSLHASTANVKNVWQAVHRKKVAAPVALAVLANVEKKTRKKCKVTLNN